MRESGGGAYNGIEIGGNGSYLGNSDIARARDVVGVLIREPDADLTTRDALSIGNGAEERIGIGDAAQQAAGFGPLNRVGPQQRVVTGDGQADVVIDGERNGVACGQVEVATPNQQANAIGIRLCERRNIAWLIRTEDWRRREHPGDMDED